MAVLVSMLISSAVITVITVLSIRGVNNNTSGFPLCGVAPDLDYVTFRTDVISSE
jgi:hypothetical protein